MGELYHRATGPVIRQLRDGWQKPKEDELQRLLNRLPDLPPESQQEIRQAFERLVNKLLHTPLESLRDESRQGVPHGLLDALARLFQLRDWNHMRVATSSARWKLPRSIVASNHVKTSALPRAPLHLVAGSR